MSAIGLLIGLAISVYALSIFVWAFMDMVMGR